MGHRFLLDRNPSYLSGFCSHFCPSFRPSMISHSCLCDLAFRPLARPLPGVFSPTAEAASLFFPLLLLIPGAEKLSSLPSCKKLNTIKLLAKTWAVNCDYFLKQQFKHIYNHMFWKLQRTVSKRCFFWVPTTCVLVENNKINFWLCNCLEAYKSLYAFCRVLSISQG